MNWRATWIVVSHFRPKLLELTLPLLRDTIVPEGWDTEIVVAYHENDPESGMIAVRNGAKAVPTREPYPSGKRNAALLQATGDLIMTTDDDDFQSPWRLAHAAAAYMEGHPLSGIREFRRLHLATGNVVRYCGRGSTGVGMDLPPVYCGTARNYARTLILQHSGWKASLPSLEDTDLHSRITARAGADPGIAEHDLGSVLADATIALQHDANIFGRPEIGEGQRTVFGEYLIVGEGHFAKAPNFPPRVAEQLRGIIG